ncbi:unnamed protein product [Paramecium primaurelia]|uniref:Phosphagen kinase N-terminal domain-containing protein n=1 Tax=Paramecium primaurelia TaxID=5886 RepID=A0A8S1LS45_PARPR|nr:unnamed protein product [Paramecium primaurelia]
MIFNQYFILVLSEFCDVYHKQRKIFLFIKKNIQYYRNQIQCVFKLDAHKLQLDADGNVDFAKIQARWDDLKSVKVSLGNKYFTSEVVEKAKTLPQQDQQRFLNLMLAGLTNDDSSVGISATNLKIIILCLLLGIINQRLPLNIRRHKRRISLEYSN